MGRSESKGVTCPSRTGAQGVINQPEVGMLHRSGLALLVCSLAVFHTAQAQTALTVGPVVGLNFSTFGGKDAEGVNSRTGFLVGGYAAFQLSPRFVLEPALLFTQKGGGVDFDGGQGTIKLTYVQVPLLGRLRFPSGGFAPNLVFGPALGFRTGCTASGNQGPVEVSVDCDEADVNLSSTDFSLILGAGLEVGRLLFSVRYDYGLTAVPGDSSGNVFNRVWSLIAQYGFRLK